VEYLKENKETHFLENEGLDKALLGFKENTYLGKAIRDALGYTVSEFFNHYNSIVEKTKSPIETKYIEALLGNCNSFGVPLIYHPWDLNRVMDIFHKKEEIGAFGLHVEPQYKFIINGKKYVVDFLLLSCLPWDSGIRKTIIETDGHDFHEKTKKQAQSDKSRDRDFISKGFTVLRFTGSEIHKDADACAEETLRIIGR
jgi:very-short-patch-repair endonuclease